MSNIRIALLGAAVILVAAGAVALQVPEGASAAVSLPSTGTRIKGTTFSAVYYYAINGKRYVFPDEKTYRTWYPNFSGVITISDAALAAIPIGGNVTYRPGVRMVKIQSAPKTYVVAKGGTLRWVTEEAIAAAYYSSEWATKVDDVPDAFFANYVEGTAVDEVDDYSPSAASASATSIDADKGIKAVIVKPPPPPPPPPEAKTIDVSYTSSGFVPMKLTLNIGDAVRWSNGTTHDLLVRPNPHPEHLEFPNFAVDIPVGESGQYTFTKAISFGYHSHLSSGAWGTITVATSTAP
jgi:plastocyanin